jgi:serine O-acetyltransferase
MFQVLNDDLESIIARDPAARSRLEVALTYPGFHAVLLHRPAHWLWRRGWRFLGRLLSQIARLMTGIEIHPGATVGRRLFIDHGMGVVFGETAEIGDDVTIYQGVTLGGVSPSVDSAAQVNRKRHPTIRDGAIIGSGAQVLGPIIVGERARVGANAVVTKDVFPGCAVVGVPARPISANCGADFAAYGMPAADLPDPIARAIDGLVEQVATLRQRVEELETQRKSFENVTPLGRASGAEHAAGADESGGAVQPLRRLADS